VTHRINQTKTTSKTKTNQYNDGNNPKSRFADGPGGPGGDRACVTDSVIRSLGESELEIARFGRARLSQAHFELLTVIGRGAFGEVRLVREKAAGRSGPVMAMKKLKKADMLRKDQVAHVMSERNLMVTASAGSTPWVVDLLSARICGWLWLALWVAVGWRCGLWIADGVVWLSR
jgi:serine/threonine protein kinase